MAAGREFDTPDLHHNTTFCVHAATTKQEVVFIPPVWCSEFSCPFNKLLWKILILSAGYCMKWKMQLQLTSLLHFVMLLFSTMVHYYGWKGWSIVSYDKGAIKEALKRLSLVFGVFEHLLLQMPHKYLWVMSSVRNLSTHNRLLENSPWTGS